MPIKGSFFSCPFVLQCTTLSHAEHILKYSQSLCPFEGVKQRFWRALLSFYLEWEIGRFLPRPLKMISSVSAAPRLQRMEQRNTLKSKQGKRTLVLMSLNTTFYNYISAYHGSLLLKASLLQLAAIYILSYMIAVSKEKKNKKTSQQRKTIHLQSHVCKLQG